MRTADEIRAHSIDELKLFVCRPQMHGGNAFGVELLMRNALDNLSYIDECEAEWEKARADLQHRGQSNCLGVGGSFLQRVGEAGEYSSEIASVYAVVAYRLGFLSIDLTLAAGDFRRIHKGLRTACRKRDWRLPEVIDHFGPPTMTVGHTVLAYVPSTPSGGWIFFDFEHASADWAKRDYVLRDVRVPAKEFEHELTFTPHGKRRREGRENQAT